MCATSKVKVRGVAVVASFVVVRTRTTVTVVPMSILVRYNFKSTWRTIRYTMFYVIICHLVCTTTGTTITIRHHSSYSVVIDESEIVAIIEWLLLIQEFSYS